VSGKLGKISVRITSNRHHSFGSRFTIQNSDVDHSRVDLIKFLSSAYQSHQDLFIVVTNLEDGASTFRGHVMIGSFWVCLDILARHTYTYVWGFHFEKQQNDENKHHHQQNKERKSRNSGNDKGIKLKPQPKHAILRNNILCRSAIELLTNLLCDRLSWNPHDRNVFAVLWLWGETGYSRKLRNPRDREYSYMYLSVMMRTPLRPHIEANKIKAYRYRD